MYWKKLYCFNTEGRGRLLRFSARSFADEYLALYLDLFGHRPTLVLGPQCASFRRDGHTATPETRHSRSDAGVAVHWFRKGLRLHDNPALIRALAHSRGRTVPLFVIDPWFCTESGRVVRSTSSCLNRCETLTRRCASSTRSCSSPVAAREVSSRVRGGRATLLTFEAADRTRRQDGSISRRKWKDGRCCGSPGHLARHDALAAPCPRRTDDRVPLVPQKYI